MTTRTNPVTLAEFRAALLVYKDSDHVNPTSGPNGEGSCLYSIGPTVGNPDGHPPSRTGATHCLIGQVIVDLGLEPFPSYAGGAGAAITDRQAASSVDDLNDPPPFEPRDLENICDLASEVQSYADGEFNPMTGGGRDLRTWADALRMAEVFE